MHTTLHMDARMNQRGIKKEMVDLALSLGDVDGDRFTLTAKACISRIEELKREMKVLEQAKRKGGVTVIACDDAQITTYSGNGSRAPWKKKIRG